MAELEIIEVFQTIHTDIPFSISMYIQNQEFTLKYDWVYNSEYSSIAQGSL